MLNSREPESIGPPVFKEEPESSGRCFACRMVRPYAVLRPIKDPITIGRYHWCCRRHTSASIERACRRVAEWRQGGTE
jgi:hypothetical protein